MLTLKITTLKTALLSLLFVLATAAGGHAQQDTTTNLHQEDYFLSFVKKVYLNPTVLLMTQEFRENHNVGVIVLPDMNGQSANTISGFERAMQKIIRFILEGGDEGSIRFYFDATNHAAPFSLVYSESLHCKFSPADQDSIKRRLNAPFQQTSFTLNSHVLFEAAISGGLAYAGNCLNRNTAACGEPADQETTEINTKPLSISLHNTIGSKYDVDSKQYEQLESWYGKANDVFTGQPWYAPAKYMATGSAHDEPVAVAIHANESGFKKQNLTFKMLYNEEVLPITPASTNDTVKLLLPRTLPPGQPVEIVVTYKSPRDSIVYTVGYFMVHVFEPQTVRLNLLAVNGFVLDAAKRAQVAAELQKIYAPVGIQFEIAPPGAQQLIAESDWTTTITIANSGLLSNYPPDLRDWVRGVEDLTAYDKSEYYLVFGLNTADLAGYMPRARNIGFIFSGAANLGQTTAHELGHGIFHLRHIFAEEELGTSYTRATQNVMDYASVQKDLFLHQWKSMDDPAFVGWLEGDDEDAESELSNLNLIESLKNTSTDTYTFFTPAGKVITLPAKGLSSIEVCDRTIFETNPQGQRLLIPSGTLTHFVLQGKDYSSYAVDNYFRGYACTENGVKIFYDDTLTRTIPEAERAAIIAFPYYKVTGGFLQAYLPEKPLLAFRRLTPKSSYTWPVAKILYSVGTQHMFLFDTKALFLDDFKEDASHRVDVEDFFVGAFSDDARKFLALNSSPTYSRNMNTVIEIVNYASANKAAFSAFNACHPAEMPVLNVDSIFGFSPSNCPACTTHVDKAKAYADKLSAYYTNLKAFANENAAVNSKIESWTGSREGLMNYVGAHYCAGFYIGLSFEARKRYLTVMADQTSDIPACVVSETNSCAEGQIIGILKDAHPNHYKALLAHLSANNYRIFHNIYAGVENHLNGSQNFDELLAVLSSMAVFSYADYESLIEKDRFYNYHSVDWDQVNQSALEATQRYFRSSYDSTTNTVDIWLVRMSGGGFGGHIVEQTAHKTYGPFDIIAIYAADPYSYASEALEIAWGETMLVPAIYLPGTNKSERDREFFRNFNMTVAVVGAVIAMPTIAADIAAGGVQAYLGVAELAATTITTVTTVTGLLEHLTPGSWQYEMVDNMNTFSTYFLLFRAGVATTKALYAAGMRIGKYTGTQYSWFKANYPEYYESFIAKTRDLVDKLLRRGAQAETQVVTNGFSISRLATRQTINFTEFVPQCVASDQFIDVIIHYRNGKFVAVTENAAGRLIESTMPVEQLGAMLDALDASKKIRLLSCNDLNAARKLSLNTTKRVYASSGKVKMYVDGVIESEEQFYQFYKGSKVDDGVIPHAEITTGGTKSFVILGEVANGAGGTLKKVVLGSDDLSQAAINFRKGLGVPNHKGNVAVFEYMDNSGVLVKKIFTTEVGVTTHSEQLAKTWFETNNIPKSSVKRIYSELEPCELEASKCKEMLNTEFSNAQKSYSYDYPGGNTSGAAIRQQSINQRFNDLIELLK